MRKFTILIICTAYFSSSFGQSKLLVTDFIFFNNFDSPHEAYIPDFFAQDSEQLQFIKELTSTTLGKKYDSVEVSFHDKSTWFVGYLDPNSLDPSESYSNNHKKLVKEGGYDYYLRFYADVSVTNQSNGSKEYSFSLQVRISDSRGKKVFRNILRAPFSSSFSSSEVNSGALLSKGDFYSFLESGIPEVFKDEKIRLASRVTKRPINSNFEEIAKRATSYVLEKSGSKNPVLRSSNNTNMELRISQGFQNEKEPVAIFSDNLELRTTIKIRNSQIEEDWKVWVAAKSKKALGILETGGENADIRIRAGKQNHETFELRNGNLTGEIDDIPYLITYESDSRLALIYVNQKLSALLQPNGFSNSTLKVLFEGNEDELTTVLNLHQVYNQAIFTLREARNRNN